jgi:rhodanese-related sulfurtransferase
MPNEIHREEVLRLRDQGALIVEVLSARQYAQAHLVGAQNIPLEQLDEQSTRQLAKNQPVIVYCYDYQ